MKWPWVSVEEYDAQVERANRLGGQVNALTMHNESLARIVTIEGERFAALLEKYHAATMPPLVPKNAGGDTTTPATIQTPRSESPIAKKIRDESAGDPSLAAHYWRYVADLKRDGKKEEEIVGMIGWTTADPPEVTG